MDDIPPAIPKTPRFKAKDLTEEEAVLPSKVRGVQKSLAENCGIWCPMCTRRNTTKRRTFLREQENGSHTGKSPRRWRA